MNRRHIASLAGFGAFAATECTVLAAASAPTETLLRPIFDRRQMGAAGDEKLPGSAGIDAAIDARADGDVSYLASKAYSAVILKSNITQHFEE